MQSNILFIAFLFLTVSFIGCQDSESFRVDCLPDRKNDNQDESLCKTRGCTWNPPESDLDAPSCFYPPSYGYKAVSQPIATTHGERVYLQKIGDETMFGGDFVNVTVDIEYQTNNRLRVKISPTDISRYQVPISIVAEDTVPENPSYAVQYTWEPVFSFQVLRKNNGRKIFDSSLGGLVISDQFLQISGLIPSENIYGFAEQEQPSFKHDVHWKTWGMFARDHAPEGDANLYGVHPHYTVIEENGDTHGVLFLNSNAQDVTLTPAPGLVYRTIGGILDMYFFTGPSPENVVSQYTQAVGRYYMPPYWSLGFHLCRWGYNSLDNMKAAWQRTIDAGIPFDVQWGDIDYMDRRLDFTVSQTDFAGLEDFVNDLHSIGMKFVPILDPAISTGEPVGSYPAFDQGDMLDIWVKNSSGSPLLGQVWPDNFTYFPDFSSPITQQWWIDQILDFHNTIKFDGIWIDMNEPASFVVGSVHGCPNNSLNYPPYKPYTDGPDLLQKTICLDAEQYWGSHYDTHSMYGWSETEPTLRGARLATGQRSLVLSRSTFVGSGRWTAHWLGDNWSEWDNLHFSIIGMMQFNQFGIPLVGADICGFIGNSTEELCARWHQLGSFYPFSRNHNVLDAYDQDPGVWEGEIVATAARTSLLVKYRLLPYLYSLFYQHTITGGTVVRPLWHSWPSNKKTYNIDTQFMWGEALVIAPIIEQGVFSREVYLPENEIWYDFNTLEQISAGDIIVGNENDTFSVVPVFARGGYMIPTQEAAMTTKESRRTPMTLNVFLGENNDEIVHLGGLYLDDGDSIDAEIDNYSYVEFSLYEGHLLKNFPITTKYKDYEFVIGTVLIIGMKENVTNVIVNNGIHEDFEDGHVLRIYNLNLDPTTPFEILWS